MADTVFTYELIPRKQLEWCILIVGASQVVLEVKNPPAKTGNVTHVSSNRGSGRFAEGGNGNPP